MLDLSVLMLVFLYITVMRRYFFPAKQGQKRASYRPAGHEGKVLADERIDWHWPDAGDEHGRDETEERTWFLKRARTGEAGGGNGVGMRYWHGSGLSGKDTGAVESYRSAALRGSPEERVEEPPDDDEGERSRQASRTSPKGRRITSTSPTKADRRDDAVQSSRRDKKAKGPMQRVGPKEKRISKAAAAPSSRPAKKVKAQSTPVPAEADALPASLPSRPVVLGKKPASLPEKAASLPSRPVVPPGKRIRPMDAAGLSEKPPRKQPTPRKPAIKTAPPQYRQEALDVSNLIVGALVSGKYEEVYAAMSRTYRDAVPEDAIGIMIEQMCVMSGGRMVAAELGGDEAGFYRGAGGEENAKHTFRYSVRTEEKKETCAFFVEIVREGNRLACADFFYATPSAGGARKSENTPA